MSTTVSPHLKLQGKERFRRNLVRAQLVDLISMLSGDSQDLLQFAEVAKRFHARQEIERGTQNVELKQIVGSVGRYRDFTRTFLPRQGVSQERWANVDAVVNSMEGFPPVELYKIGDVYFVRDGNHRVSVARANGFTSIEAYVTELKAPVPLTVDDFERDRWIIKAEMSDFLTETRLNELRPDATIEFTEPGRYQLLIDQIRVHRYLQNEAAAQSGVTEQVLTWAEAVESWYDTVYMPVVEYIHRYDLLAQFPTRTESDLYMWITLHRERLATHYEIAPLSPEASVSTFAETHSERPLVHAVQELKLGLRHALGMDDVPLGMSPDEFEESRLRHDAGEVSLGEAGKKQRIKDEEQGNPPE